MNKDLKKTIIAIAICSTLILLAYFLNFRDLPISKDGSVWGAFGDYFGGLINPILGIINVIILINITFQISKIDDDRVKDELVIQKQIALYALKHDGLKELSQILEKFQPELIKSEERSALNIILYRNEFNAYIDTYSYLFPFFENRTWEALRNSMETLSDITQQRFEQGNDFDIENILKPKLIEFNDLKSNFIVEVQRTILN